MVGMVGSWEHGLCSTIIWDTAFHPIAFSRLQPEVFSVQLVARGRKGAEKIVREIYGGHSVG